MKNVNSVPFLMETSWNIPSDNQPSCGIFLRSRSARLQPRIGHQTEDGQYNSGGTERAGENSIQQDDFSDERENDFHRLGGIDGSDFIGVSTEVSGI